LVAEIQESLIQGTQKLLNQGLPITIPMDLDHEAALRLAALKLADMVPAEGQAAESEYFLDASSPLLPLDPVWEDL
jgi:hypothetical protein